MPTVTDSEILLIAYEGEFQLLKAQVLDVVAPPVAPGTPSLDQLRTLLKALEQKTRDASIVEVYVPLTRFIYLVELGELSKKMATLKAEFAAAAVKASALSKAAKIAKDGAENLSIITFNKTLGDLFNALDQLKRGLDLLSSLGVKGTDFDDARKKLGEALDVVKDKKKSGG